MRTARTSQGRRLLPEPVALQPKVRPAPLGTRGAAAQSLPAQLAGSTAGSGTQLPASTPPRTQLGAVDGHAPGVPPPKSSVQGPHASRVGSHTGVVPPQAPASVA